MTISTIDISSVYVIYNESQKEDAFKRGIEKHLGESHTLREREEYTEGWSNEYVGFGGEVWRGKFYYEGDRCVALQLLANFNDKPGDVALATLGLAVLTFNKGARLSDVVLLP